MVPMPLTSMIGRQRELGGVEETLRKRRLVTLTGPGGVGKTRLALELAHRQGSRRRDGIWFVDLALGEEEPDVALETARAFDVRTPKGAAPTDGLRDYLADRDLLLVLDNCEHVVAACAELAVALLSACAHTRIVATSREPLGVSGEAVWRLEPLYARDAHRLFMERARQRRPDFLPEEEEDATIEQLCKRLDRLPLTIELAAARIGVMSPAEILAGVEAHLGMLGGGLRLTAPRHKTVAATVEWSYELLDSDERKVLRSLAVFVGGFDAAAAAAIAPELSLDVLARLVDKSLVAASHSPGGRTRYRLLETVRQHAYELLADAGELGAACARHFGYFSSLADAEPDAYPSRSAERIVAELADNYQNVRAALEWAVASNSCEARAAFFAARDLFLLLGQADGQRIAEELLVRCATRDRRRAEIQVTAGMLAMMTVDIASARAALAGARELSIELDEPALQGWAAFFEGLTETLSGEFESACTRLEECRSLHRRTGIRIGEGLATAALGLGCAITGDPVRGVELLEEALSIQRSENYGWGEGQAHVYLCICSLGADWSTERVREHSRAAVEALRAYRESPLLPMALVAQAATLVRSDPERALRIAAAAFAMRARIGGGFPPVFRDLADRVLAGARAAVGPERKDVAGEGARLGVDEAIAVAFGDQRAPEARPGGLSVREQEVTRLVANGRSNKEIAAHLQLSVRTVESHVRHALTKLALDNRTQLATWARERIQ
jgi:non-specific serine/threonine protein kinase